MLRDWKSGETAARGIWIWGLTAIALLVRLVFTFLHRVDSDEPQHLHVAWAWSRGLVQYRDVFDNHFPLLHLLFAPLMPLMPESSDVFLLARLAITPLAIACAWLVYKLGAPLIGTRAAATAALLFSVMPPWLPKSVEFRNDTLWIFFWLVSLTLIVARKRPMYIAAGIAAALCLLASVKALPLFLAHALALIPRRNDLSGMAAARMAGGAAIPLAAIACLMFALGAFDEMLYGTLLFNASLPVDAVRRIGGALAFAVVAPALALRGPRLLTNGDSVALHLRLFAVWYTIVVLCFWPIVTPRDLLPLVPLGAIAVAGSRVGRATPVGVIMVAILCSVWHAELWTTPDRARHRFVDAAAHLTTRDEYVFDFKGDAVFRRRPVYYIYDIVGRTLTSEGMLPDLGPEQIVAHGCCVAIRDSARIPERTRAFLNQHFVDAGAVRVCGATVRNGTFTIAVPQRYAVSGADHASISIDGTPYTGPRFLKPGRHTLTNAGNRNATVLWWRAVKGAV